MFQKVLVATLVVMGIPGCATFKSLDASIPGGPKIYSETRLDISALTGNKTSIRKFKTEAPAYPLLNLPFSFAFDTVLLPLSIPRSIYEDLVK
jgi:uncharacterized protein YceK